MAKKIKLPLEMANGVAVRTIEELKENWDLEKVVSYYHNGRLLMWLNDRYYDEKAEQVQALSGIADTYELQKQLCGIFEVPFTEEETVDVEVVAARNEKLNKLRKLTSDDDILKNVDKVAFNQEELADLLEEDEPVIYLADNKFSIPLTVKNKKYVGIGDATAVIKSNQPIDFEKLGITFINIIFDKKYTETAKSPKRLTELGDDCYENENYKNAFKFYKEAAEQGVAEAQTSLAGMYYDGEGVIQDYAEAARWYRKAADNGDDDAQYNLGDLYYYGKGVTQDYAKAAEWYQKAVEQENELAKNMFSYIRSPLPGRVSEFKCKIGDIVEAEQVAMIIEDMRMQYEILISERAWIYKICVKIGDEITDGEILISYLKI